MIQEVFTMWGIIVALISGALMSIQGVLNAGVTKQTSLWVSSSFVQFTALIICLVAWFVTGRESSFGALLRIDHKYMLLGGALGAFITITVIQSMNGLGPAKAALLIVVSQLIIAYVIELLGLCGVERHPFEWRKLLGMVIMITGIVIFKWER